MKRCTPESNDWRNVYNLLKPDTTALFGFLFGWLVIPFLTAQIFNAR